MPIKLNTASGGGVILQGANTASDKTITIPADDGTMIYANSSNRITGDFSNATVANRVMFQTSTVNGGTLVRAVPNGTSQLAGFQASNSADPTNSSGISVQIDSAGVASVQSIINGTGTYLPLTLNTGGSERMRIDTSGNVGIGTSSPSQRLNVTGAGASITDAVIRINNPNTSAFSTAVLDFYSNGVSRGQVFGQQNGSSNGGFLIFNTGDSSNVLQERMRIDSSGNLLVGATSAGSAGLSIYPPLAGNANTPYIQFNRSNTASAGTALLFQNNSSTVGSITHSNTATAYNTSSDYRLKHDIRPMSGALAKVAALKPVNYKWNVDDSDGEGFIAHELAEICPGAVTGEKDAVDADGNPVYQGIDTSFLVATLTAAIQELKAEVDQLRAQVEAK